MQVGDDGEVFLVVAGGVGPDGELKRSVEIVEFSLKHIGKLLIILRIRYTERKIFQHPLSLSLLLYFERLFFCLLYHFEKAILVQHILEYFIKQ